MATTDDVKPKAEAVDDIETQKAAANVPAQFEGAVGYKEYLEAIDLEVSDKEVRTGVFPRGVRLAADLSSSSAACAGRSTS